MNQSISTPRKDKNSIVSCSPEFQNRSDKIGNVPERYMLPGSPWCSDIVKFYKYNFTYPKVHSQSSKSLVQNTVSR